MADEEGYLADDERSAGSDDEGSVAGSEAGYLGDDEYSSGDESDGSVGQGQAHGGDDAPDDGGGGAIDYTIGQEYQAILDALDGMANQVGARYALVRQTIVAAALIEANAALIAAAGPQARDKVLEITGAKPSSGFVGETADGVASRAQVLPAVWGQVTDQGAELAFFLGAFGTDPCIAARLNGVTEYTAQLQGIPPEALQDAATYNQQLIGQIGGAHDAYLETNPAAPYGADAFRAWLGVNYPAIVADPDFGSSWGSAKDVLMLQ